MLLKTKRLTLRPFTLDDAERVQKLAGEWEIASMTANIPHPYPLEIAVEWIRSHDKDRKEGKLYTFAICLEPDLLIGAISIKVNKEAHRAEMGYWLGKDFWGNGYTTEAAEEMLRFGFEELALNRIVGTALTRNPASIRVLEKIGLRREGILRQHVYRFGRYDDLAHLGILREEWQSQR